MNILPAMQRASTAKDAVANLFSGTKNTPDSSNAKKSLADPKNAPDFSGMQNVQASSDIQSIPGVPDTRNAQAKTLADQKNAPASSGMQKTQASSAQNVPGAPDTRTIPAFSEARKSLADQKNVPDSSGMQKSQVPSAVQNVPGVSNTRNIPAFSGAKKITSFADALRQAREEVQRASSGYTRNIRDRLQEHLQSGSRKTGNGTSNAASPRAAAAARQVLGAAAAAESEAFRLNTRQQGISQGDRQQYTPLEKAPVAMHSTNGVHYELGEVGFTQQELSKLRDKLLKEGLAPQSLTAIEQLASHPHGATLGQLLSLMDGSLLQKVSLSDYDKASLQNFTSKIDSSGTLGKNVLDALEQGQSRAAWDAIKSSFAALNPQEPLVFEAGEAALICRAFGVSPRASAEVLKQFGNAESVLITPEGFTALMVPAQQEILDKSQQNDKLGQALAKHLQPIIDEARLRSEKESKAANGEDRKSKRSEILIRDKITSTFHKDVAAPEKDDAGRNPLIGRKDASGKKNAASGGKDEAGHNPPTGGKAESAGGRAEAQGMRTEESVRPEGQAARTPLRYEEELAATDKLKAAVTATSSDDSPAPQKSASSGRDASNGAEADAGQKEPPRLRFEQARDGRDDTNQDARRDSQREMPLARAEVRQSAQTVDMRAVAVSAMPVQPQEQSGGHLSSPVPLVRQALQQVDQVSLGRLTNGDQRLELQLAPSELGAVTLILTSGKSGEISATIRSERHETAELVSRHLDMIRVSLEEQGLKVDKLEVQNQMLNNQDNWQGMEQHNAMREEQERREQLERLRRLGRLGESDAARAQDMQLHEHTAEISGQGLHLVA
ncbi:MAG: flagellar hook-length control protein FliK [Betaproteobacteria bacterium]|nr:flagellar hook-length control protein FliK [Betaproteobacteria bacterium]